MHQERDEASGPSIPDVGAFLDEFLASLDALAPDTGRTDAGPPDAGSPGAGRSDDLGGGGARRS